MKQRKTEREPLMVDLADDLPDEKRIKQEMDDGPDPGAGLVSTALALLCVPFWVVTPCFSFLAVKPQEHYVILSMGKYAETIKTPGIHFANCWGRDMLRIETKVTAIELAKTTVLDVNGNPLIISAVVTYEVVNAKRALLEVNDVHYFIRANAEAALKAGLSKFPYESQDGSPCLKTEAVQIGRQLCYVLQSKVYVAGVLVHSFQLKEISYAPEIAGVMLKRQQAQALIDARNTIVEGAVEICAHAIDKLRAKGIELNNEQEAKIVGNLLTVTCSESQAVPTIPL